MAKVCQRERNVKLIIEILIVDCRTLDFQFPKGNTKKNEQYAQLHLIYIIYIKSTNLQHPLCSPRIPKAMKGEILYPSHIPSFSILTPSKEE